MPFVHIQFRIVAFLLAIVPLTFNSLKRFINELTILLVVEDFDSWETMNNKLVQLNCCLKKLIKFLTSQ